MSVTCNEGVVVFADACGVEDAETVLGYLLEDRERGVDLGACGHLHTAVLQVLRAAAPPIARWPEDQAFRAWLRRILNRE